MESNAVQKTSWPSKWVQAASRAASGAGERVAYLASKAADLWSSTPKALKLPLETAGILASSGDWMGVKGALAAAVVLTETPKDLALFLSNQPVKFFGERWRLFGSYFPTDPKVPLTDLDQKIGAFERTHTLLGHPVMQVKTTDLSLPNSSDTTPASLRKMEKTTDRNLEILIEKVSYLSILKVLHSFSGVVESDSSFLMTLVDEASRTKKPSLWKLFIGHYGPKISWWGRLKAGVLYAFLWSWIPIVPRTVEAYMKNMLSELRVNLKENGEKRKKFINGLLEDADNFFEVYNGAAETYANDNARKGNLNYYRKQAIDLMLPKNEAQPNQTADDLRMDLYRKLSASIVDHFSPKVRFGFLEGWLNNRIKNTLRDTILPEVFLSISDEGKEATKRHNIPFFLALTRTLTAQVSKLQGKLEEDSSDPSTLGGIKNFESIVKKVLWAIDMAECKTVEEVRIKIETLKEPETGIDAEVRGGIQLGIQKGLAVLFDYLSKQENTEELFANLFESVAVPLSGNLPMNDKQWAEMTIEYEGAKILLKQAGSALSKQIVQEAVQDKVWGGSVPEVTERMAQKIFAEHKIRGQETFEETLRLCDAIQEKIKQSKDFCVDETSIHTELGALASTLKAFENQERVKITTEQDPPPQIALLPNADREAILRVLYPLYEGSDQIMDLVLSLQSLQRQHTARVQVARELRQIKEALEEIAASQTEASLRGPIERMAIHFKNIEAIDSVAAAKLWGISEQIESIRQILSQIESDQKSLEALEKLQPFPALQPAPKTGLLDQLVLYIQGTPPPGFKKWRCVEQIKENVKAASFSPEEEPRVLQLVEMINKYNAMPDPRPDFDIEIWGPLSALLNGRKNLLDTSRRQNGALLERIISRAHQNCSFEEAKTHKLGQRVWEEMREKGTNLHTEALRLRNLIDRAKKEILVHPSAAQIGQIGGTLGFLLGLSTGTFSPVAGGAIGAVAATAVANLGNLAKRKWLKFGVPVVGAGAAAGLAAKYAADASLAQFPNAPYAPALISAAGASAGLEYFGAKMTKRLIDTGVEIAMPKVTQIFDTAYEHLLTSDVVINGGLKILMKQLVELFPPKK